MATENNLGGTVIAGNYRATPEDGHGGFYSMTPPTAAPTNVNTALYADSTGRLVLVQADNLTRTFNMPITANRIYTWPDANGTLVLADAVGTTFTSPIVKDILFTSSTTAPIIAAGPGAGSGATATITGSQQSGVISISTGLLPSANAVVATITMSKSMGSTNYAPILQARNSAVLSIISKLYAVPTSATTWTINNGDILATLGLGQTYQFNYWLGA